MRDVCVCVWSWSHLLYGNRHVSGSKHFCQLFICVTCESKSGRREATDGGINIFIITVFSPGSGFAAAEHEKQTSWRYQHPLLDCFILRTSLLYIHSPICLVLHCFPTDLHHPPPLKLRELPLCACVDIQAATSPQ